MDCFGCWRISTVLLLALALFGSFPPMAMGIQSESRGARWSARLRHSALVPASSFASSEKNLTTVAGNSSKTSKSRGFSSAADACRDCVATANGGCCWYYICAFLFAQDQSMKNTKFANTTNHNGKNGTEAGGIWCASSSKLMAGDTPQLCSATSDCAGN